MKIIDGTNYIDQVKELIIEYTSSLGRDLSFQHIEEELDNPSQKYTAPEGEVLVVLDNYDRILGMVAYHRHTDERCEMKRLYVRPECRGLQMGEHLVTEIIAHAQTAGFKEIVLDTLKPMTSAIQLYKKNGFEECEAYYLNPMEDVIYMRKML